MRLSQELTREMDCTKIPKFSFIDHPYSIHSDIFQVSLDTEKLSDDDEKTPVIDDEFGPPPIFPLMALYHTRELPDDRLNPRYADRWPIGFDKTHKWPHVWTGQTLPLDKFIQEFRLPYRRTYVTAIEERNYLGTPWRLRIDEVKASSGMPILRHGMTVSYHNSNTRHLRYIIDHCIFRDTTVAYLKVYCFNLDQDICDSESTRPPFLLTIPIQYCQVRDYPNDSHSYHPSLVSPLESHSHPPPQSHFSEEGEISPGITVRIYRFVRQIFCC